MANTLTLSGTVTKYEGGTILPVQRNINNITSLTFRGMYGGGGTPSGIKAQWKGGSFVDLINMTIAGGNWEGTLAAQSGDEGTLNLQWANDATATDTTYLALGDYFLIIGDSIAVGAHVNGALSSATPKHTRYAFAPPTKWVEWDSTSAGPDGGSWPYLGTEITASQSVPVGFIDAAVSGSQFFQWVHGQADFNDAMATVTTWGLTSVRGVLVHLGANDARQGNGQTPASVKTQIQQTCADLDAWLPGGPAPIFWAPIGPVDANVGGGILRDEMDAIRQGLINTVAAGSCVFGPWLHDETYPDQLHPTITNAHEIGGRWWLAISDTLYGTSNGHGPRVSSVTFNTAKTSFVTTTDKNLGNSVPSSTIGGRVINGDLSIATITTQTISGVRQLTEAVSPAAIGTVTVSFASGNDAIGSTAPKGSTETLPSGLTVQRVLESNLNHATIPESASTARFGTVFAGVVR